MRRSGPRFGREVRGGIVRTRATVAAVRMNGGEDRLDGYTVDSLHNQ